MTITPQQLAEWKAKGDKLKETRPLPWSDDCTEHSIRDATGSGVVSGEEGTPYGIHDLDAADFIVTASRAWPLLIAEVERLQNLVERAKPFAGFVSSNGSEMGRAKAKDWLDNANGKYALLSPHRKDPE